MARTRDAELATSEWVDWFNHRRLHSAWENLPSEVRREDRVWHNGASTRNSGPPQHAMNDSLDTVKAGGLVGRADKPRLIAEDQTEALIAQARKQGTALLREHGQDQVLRCALADEFTSPRLRCRHVSSDATVSRIPLRFRHSAQSICVCSSRGLKPLSSRYSGRPDAERLQRVNRAGANRSD